MKKVALFAGLFLLFAVSAAFAQNLYCPWIVETMDSVDPTTGSFNTNIFVYNTDAATQTATVTFHKWGTELSTSFDYAIDPDETASITWRPIALGDWFGDANFPGVRIGQVVVTNTNQDFIGFVTRYRSNYSPIYAEALWAWTNGSGQ